MASFLKALGEGAVGGILGGANSLVKTVFGSKEQRDADAHKEQMSVMDQFAAEFLPRENRTKWDSFVDGLNRLPRPFFTFGTIYLFYYCIRYPADFAVAMEALKLMPEYGWALLGTIVTFWFGGKFIGALRGAKMNVDPETVKTVLAFYQQREQQKKTEAVVPAAEPWKDPDK